VAVFEPQDRVEDVVDDDLDEDGELVLQPAVRIALLGSIQ
jgi:hypothetical protein